MTCVQLDIDFSPKPDHIRTPACIYENSVERIAHRIAVDLDRINMSKVTEIHIRMYPNQGWSGWPEFRCIGEFKPGTHIPIKRTAGEWKRKLFISLLEVKGLDNEFNESRRCLNAICRHLRGRMHRNMSLTFDFMAHAPANVRSYLESLQILGKVRQMQVGFDGRRLPRGGRALVKQMMREAIEHQVEPANKPTLTLAASTSSRLCSMPPEIRAMILEHVVKDPGVIPLHAQDVSIKYTLHANRCCGSCRARTVQNTMDYRCNDDYGNASSTCQCVHLSEGIFRASTSLRLKALQQYWHVNKCMAHGSMALSSYERLSAHRSKGHGRTSIRTQIRNVPMDAWPQIRYLIIDTDCPFQSLTNKVPLRCDFMSCQNHWGWLFQYLDKDGARKLKVEVRKSLDSTSGSYYHRNFDEENWEVESAARDYRKQLILADIADSRRGFIKEVQQLKLCLDVWERQEDGSTQTIVERTV